MVASEQQPAQRGRTLLLCGLLAVLVLAAGVVVAFLVNGSDKVYCYKHPSGTIIQVNEGNVGQAGGGEFTIRTEDGGEYVTYTYSPGFNSFARSINLNGGYSVTANEKRGHIEIRSLTRPNDPPVASSHQVTIRLNADGNWTAVNGGLAQQTIC